MVGAAHSDDSSIGSPSAASNCQRGAPSASATAWTSPLPRPITTRPSAIAGALDGGNAVR
jgi:hypothetical protein